MTSSFSPLLALALNGPMCEDGTHPHTSSLCRDVPHQPSQAFVTTLPATLRTEGSAGCFEIRSMRHQQVTKR